MAWAVWPEQCRTIQIPPVDRWDGEHHSTRCVSDTPNCDAKGSRFRCGDCGAVSCWCVGGPDDLCYDCWATSVAA